MEIFQDPKKSLPEAGRDYVARIPSVFGSPALCLCKAGTPMPPDAVEWAYTPQFFDVLSHPCGHEDPCGENGVDGKAAYHEYLQHMPTEEIRKKVLTFLSQRQAQKVDCSREEFSHFAEILIDCVEYVLKGGRNG